MSDEYEFHKNKKTDKTYISPRFKNKKTLSDEEISTRRISKVFDIAELHFFEYLKEYKSIVLRKTDKEREEVILTVIEEDKKIAWISIQRFMTKTWYPKAESIFFPPEAFKKMIDFLRSIEFIDFSSPEHFQVQDSDLIKRTPTDLVEILKQIPEGTIDSKVVGLIMQKLSSDTRIKWIVDSLSNEELENISTNHIELQRKKVVSQLEERLKWDFSETKWADSWQNWIRENCWLTGANYLPPIDRQKISISGIMPDYLFPRHDGFIDIFEIKLPSDEVIKEDPSHPWSWTWTNESNKAIGQVVNYLWEIDRLRLDIEREIQTKYFKTVSLLRPCAYIIIWNDDNWFIDEPDIIIRALKRQKKLEALRKLNYALHGIEIITYAELVRRWKSFIS